MRRHDETKLPLWAQRELNLLRMEVQKREALKQAHAVLCDKDRDWFTIPNVREKSMKLWLLNFDRPFPVCSLGPGDMLFVARAKKPAAPEGPSDTDRGGEAK